MANYLQVVMFTLWKAIAGKSFRYGNVNELGEIFVSRNIHS